MTVGRRQIIDTVIDHVFRYVQCFGVTTCLYDTSRRCFVYSRIGHCYSLSLHGVLSAAFCIAFITFLTDANWAYSNLRNLYKNVMMLIEIVQYISVFVCMVLQWTRRSNVLAVFNDVLRTWRKDLARFQDSRDIKRRTAVLLCIKTAITGLIIVTQILEVRDLMNDSLLIAALQALSSILSNILLAVMFLFASGLIFSLYLFRILNFNLVRVVEDIGKLRANQRPRYALRHKIVTLEVELSEIGRIHSKLRKWVVRFKNMYQVELLLILLMFFMSVVFVAFLFVVYARAGRLMQMMGLVAVTFLGTNLYAVDLIFLLYISGKLLDASHRAGEIMKDLAVSEPGLPCVELQRTADLMYFQLKAEKLSLRVCGMFDLDWSNSFSVSEAVLLYMIILIQWDYDRI